MLQHLSLSLPTRTPMLIKLAVVIVLLTCSMKVLAGCRADQAGGWSIFTICAANFDGNGQYVNSTCQDAGPPSGGESVLNMCMEAKSVGGCSGSLCTWDGPLSD